VEEPKPDPGAAPPTLSAFCRTILEQGSLAAKLAPPPASLALDDGPALDLRAPARAPDLALRAGAGRLPPPHRLGDARARATCLARFAHHELQAVELLAWALLRWPALPRALRRDWLRVLADEQRHCRLYLARLEAHGDSLADHALSDYFWKQLPAIRAARDGPAAFLASLGLTFEQANLDFGLLYRDACRRGGDERSAGVCQQVHDDEIRHVRTANEWLRRLRPELVDDAARYEASVPFPLGAARAKGRRFDARARERAGLDRSLVELVRGARSRSERSARADARPRRTR